MDRRELMLSFPAAMSAFALRNRASRLVAAAATLKGAPSMARADAASDGEIVFADSRIPQVNLTTTSPVTTIASQAIATTGTPRRAQSVKGAKHEATTCITMMRRIKARPQIVFDAVTTAEGIAHWWCPDAGSVLLSESDPRVGGRYRLRFRMQHGTEHEASGEFLEIDPPRRVVMSWRWKGGLEDPGESCIVMRLRAIPDGTELSFTHFLLHDGETRRNREEDWSDRNAR